MSNPNDIDLPLRRVYSPYPVITVALSLAAIAATYLLAGSALEVTEKTQAFAGVVISYLFVCVILYFHQSTRKRKSDDPRMKAEDDIEAGLAALDEASTFFAGSLKSADALRLVSSRVRDVLPFQTIVLFMLNATRTQLTAVHSDGVALQGNNVVRPNFETTLASKTFASGQIEIDSYFAPDSAQQSTTVAIPLCHGENVFGVLQLFFYPDYDLPVTGNTLFEAVGTRASPLLLGSIAFERSQANALTDVTTDLPNERAFYMVLENQIAETQRKPDERPLTVLAIDIKSFDEINQKFGHSAGDRVLNFVSQVVKHNLRQMDFFARALNDEFLAVLPTATKEISHEIIARIHTGFFGRKFKVTESESIEIELNIGWAAFGGDGETPAQLLRMAQIRKDQSKSSETPKVLWFPTEMAT